MPPPRTFVVYVLLLLMELLGGFTLMLGLSLLDVSSLGYATFWLAIVVGLVAIVTAVTVPALRLQPPWDRALVLGVAAGVVGGISLLTASGSVTALMSALLFGISFWRGLVVTSEPPGYAEVQRRFGFGFCLFFVGIIGIMARGMIDNRSLWQVVAFAGIGYVVVSMMALGAARLEEDREPGALKAVVLAVAMQLALLAFLGLAALEVFSLDIFGWIGHQLQPVTDALGATLYRLILPFAQPIDDFFSSIRHHANTNGSRVSPYQPGDSQARIKKHLKHTKPLNGTPYAIAAAIVVALILIAIGYAIWRALPRRHEEVDGARPYRETREWSVRPSEWLPVLLTWLRGLLRRGTDTAGAGMRAAQRRLWGGPYPADPIRKAYVRLLRRAEAAGLRRPAQLTPAEYEAALRARWPDGAGDFTVLTRAYAERRYGDIPAGDDRVSIVQASWQRVRHIIHVPRRTGG